MLYTRSCPAMGVRPSLCLVPSARKRTWSRPRLDVMSNPTRSPPGLRGSTNWKLRQASRSSHRRGLISTVESLQWISFMPAVPAWTCTRRPSSPASAASGPTVLSAARSVPSAPPPPSCWPCPTGSGPTASARSPGNRPGFTQCVLSSLGQANGPEEGLGGGGPQDPRGHRPPAEKPDRFPRELEARQRGVILAPGSRKFSL